MRFKYEELGSAPLIVNSIYEGGSKGNPAADDALTKLFKVNGFTKSVGNRGGFRKSSKELNGKVSKEIAYVVIFSSKKIKEWPDTYNEAEGTFIYYGDNKKPGNHYLNTKQKGNSWLEDVFKKAYGPYDDRKTIPPIFIFESTGVGLNVEFLGVAVPGVKEKTQEQVLELETYGEFPNEFQNYRAHFTIIDIEPEGVSREWLTQLKDINGDNQRFAPREWINFIENGPNNLTPLYVNKQTIDDKYDILPSEKYYLRKTRMTQGKFRENLLRESSSCKVCGMNISDLLVASHIKPWKDSDDIERIDFYNGLLLCPTHNALFDSGFISFDPEGSIILSNRLDNQNVELLGLKKKIKIPLHFRHLKYMNWHTNKVFK